MPKSEELRKKMICGDWIVVAEMLNITQKNARISFSRPRSKRYPEILNAIERLIKSREELLNDKSHE